jgi:hypothetical protein
MLKFGSRIRCEIAEAYKVNLRAKFLAEELDRREKMELAYLRRFEPMGEAN